MDDNVEQRITRAKWLLDNIKFAAMATVNEDGSPLNSPYFFLASSNLKELYWGSHPGSQHSKNILRTGLLYVVLYEESDPGGLYIVCHNGRIAKNSELSRALGVHNEKRNKLGKQPLSESYYQDPMEQKMWICDTKSFWINLAIRYQNGRLKEDTKKLIARTNLV